MGGKTTILLDEVPGMQKFTRSELREIDRLLEKSKAGEITDDTLQRLRGTFSQGIGGVRPIYTKISRRVEELLSERRAFQYGINKK